MTSIDSLRSTLTSLLQTVRQMEAAVQTRQSAGSASGPDGKDASGAIDDGAAGCGCCGTRQSRNPFQAGDSFTPAGAQQQQPSSAGGDTFDAAPSGATQAQPSIGPGAAGGAAPVGGELKGDNSPQPSFGGWAWSKPDVNAISRAGFNWFETGYPDTLNQGEYQQLRDSGVRPFVYVNMGEVTPDLKPKVGGGVPVLRHNGDWNTDVVDVRDPTWQKWLVDRANYAYDRGARGIKWDCAGIEGNYKDPAEKQQALDAMGKVMQTLKEQHPDFKFIVNQGYALANAYPKLVDGVENESLMSARDQGGGMTQWADEEIAKNRELHEKYGMPILMADYADPSSDKAKRWADTISGMGFTPYITSDHWDIMGRGLGINPGWN